MRLTAITLFGILALACAACGKKPPTDAPPPGGDPPPAESPPPDDATGKAFLDATKDVPAKLEWNRDIMAIKDADVVFRLTSPAPVAVTLVTDDAYQAMVKGNKAAFKKSDVLLTVDANPPSYERRVTIPAGRVWFIIENRSDAAAKIRLECFNAK